MTWSTAVRRLAPLGRTVVVLGFAFTAAGLIFALTGYGFVDVFSGTLQGAITSPGAFTSTVRWAIPLTLIAFGVLISFRAGYFNVGAQSQLYAGAIVAAIIALEWDSGPAVVVIPTACAVAVVAGTIASLFPGWLRVRFGTDEVLTTLMLDFVSILLLQYFVTGPYKDPAGTGQVAASPVINESLRISDSSGVSPGLVAVVVVAAVVTWLLVHRTSFGLFSSVTGRNPVMARWQGINTARVGLLAFALSGAFAGLAGGLDLVGPAGRLNSGFAPTIGFTAILVALVGNLSVIGVVLAGMFFGAMQSAVLFLPIVSGLPRSAIDLFQGIVALVITVQVAIPRMRRAATSTSRVTAAEVVP
jgi:ABC-type uncharacterized transport system permease subunit